MARDSDSLTIGISVPSVRAPYLSGLRSAAALDDAIVDTAPLQDSVPLGRGTIQVHPFPLLTKLPEQRVQVVAMNVDSVLEVLVGLVRVQLEVELLWRSVWTLRMYASLL